MTRPIIELQNVDVRIGNEPILRRISWELKRGENWAVLGGNGSGKSTFLRLVRGEIRPAPHLASRRIYRLEDHVQTRSAVGVGRKMGFVSPELQERYLQQEWSLRGRDVVYSGVFNSDYLNEKPSEEQRARADRLIGELGIEALARRNVQELSSGELRKILIARALAAGPPILLLDEVCDGLDAPARTRLIETIEAIATRGTQILFSSHRADELPSCMTHLLLLEKGRIVRKDEVSLSSMPVEEKAGERRRLRSAGHSVRQDFAKLGIGGKVSEVETKPLIFIENANVFLGRKKVLHEISWSIRPGEHWAILGANGSGKSTLLKLIAGELHAACGARIRRFELTARDSIWEFKRRIGFISPALQANYHEDLTGADVVASGRSSSIGFIQKPAPPILAKAAALLRALGAGQLAKKKTLGMSYGEFRKVLLARALLNGPRILICDEPFDGLDARARDEFRDVLERFAKGGGNLVMVTHHLEDLPECMTHGMVLHGGRIANQGRLG